MLLKKIKHLKLYKIYKIKNHQKVSIINKLFSAILFTMVRIFQFISRYSYEWKTHREQVFEVLPGDENVLQATWNIRILAWLVENQWGVPDYGVLEDFLRWAFQSTCVTSQSSRALFLAMMMFALRVELAISPVLVLPIWSNPHPLDPKCIFLLSENWHFIIIFNYLYSPFQFQLYLFRHLISIIYFQFIIFVKRLLLNLLIFIATILLLSSISTFYYCHRRNVKMTIEDLLK